MTTGMYYFLTVVKEGGISRAANVLMVSQQSLSEQIKRLENIYGRLFERRPKFQLTPEGEALLRTAQQIYVLEENLKIQLQEIKDRKIGRLRVGIHSLRAMVLLPQVLEEYHKLFPNVELTFFNDDTVTLEEMLRHGDLDIFFGVDSHQYPEFEYIALGDEQIHLVASELLAEKYIRSSKSDCRDVLDISDISALPFIFRHNRSNFQSKINRFFENIGIEPNVVISITDFWIQLMLVGRNLGACFCPHLALHMVSEINRGRRDNFLRVFTVKGMNETSQLALVRHRYSFRTEYMETFVKMLRKEFKRSLLS